MESQCLLPWNQDNTSLQPTLLKREIRRCEGFKSHQHQNETVRINFKDRERIEEINFLIMQLNVI